MRFQREPPLEANPRPPSSGDVSRPFAANFRTYLQNRSRWTQEPVRPARRQLCALQNGTNLRRDSRYSFPRLVSKVCCLRDLGRDGSVGLERAAVAAYARRKERIDRRSRLRLVKDHLYFLHNSTREFTSIVLLYVGGRGLLAKRSHERDARRSIIKKGGPRLVFPKREASHERKIPSKDTSKERQIRDGVFEKRVYDERESERGA